MSANRINGRVMGRGNTDCCNLRFDDPDRRISHQIEILKKSFAAKGILAPDLYRLIVLAGLAGVKDSVSKLLADINRIEIEELTPDLFNKITGETQAK